MPSASRRRAKDELYDAFAAIARAMASGRRAEIIDLLSQSERSVDEVAREIDQSVANTSHHLRSLAHAGLVRSRRDGQRVLYRLVDERVGKLWRALRDVAVEHVAEVEVLAASYLGARDVDAVTAHDLAERMAKGRVVVLDVRPRAEYEAGHIAGARPVPIDELGEAVDALPRSREIVAYCRGPFCVYADDAVRLLRARGIRARRLDAGYPEWRDAGLPVVAPVTVPTREAG
ncbi:MAG: metalloregulator ArsR/SmtB family transcription factor [Actinobacteria bacterium]|nr:metalloregulator ArsR/SmtB family transcription factor [Actinomycetota bacterium]